TVAERGPSQDDAGTSPNPAEVVRRRHRLLSIAKEAPPMDPGYQAPPEPVALDHHSAPGRLRIKWSDGHVTDVRTDRLRALCPCANCRAERSQANPLQLRLKPSPNATELVKVTWVGRYGLTPIWGDGHETGIYTYQFLHDLPNDE